MAAVVKAKAGGAARPSPEPADTKKGRQASALTPKAAAIGARFR